MSFPTELLVDDRGAMFRVHSRHACQGRCTLHRPSEHHMRSWPIVVRESTLIERICSHGVGHPDPDSLDYFERRGVECMGVHGCDGCCEAREERP